MAATQPQTWGRISQQSNRFNGGKEQAENERYKRNYENNLKNLGVKVSYAPEMLKEGYEVKVFAVDKSNYQIGIQYQAEDGKKQCIIVATTTLKEHPYGEAKKEIEDLIEKTIITSSEKSLDLENIFIDLEEKRIRISRDGRYILSSAKMKQTDIIRTKFRPDEMERFEELAELSEEHQARIVDVKEMIVIQKMKRYIVDKNKVAEEEYRKKVRNNREVDSYQRTQEKEEQEYIFNGVKINNLTGFNFKRAEKMDIKEEERPEETRAKCYQDMQKYIKEEEKGNELDNDFSYAFKLLTPMAISEKFMNILAFNILNNRIEDYLESIPKAYRDEEYEVYQNYLQLRKEYPHTENKEEYKKLLDKFIMAVGNPVKLQKVYKEQQGASKEKER